MRVDVLSCDKSSLENRASSRNQAGLGVHIQYILSDVHVGEASK